MEETAIVSDVHANAEALNSVLQDISEQDPERIVCLGDIVGYGAEPISSIQLVQEFAFSLLGNHDDAVVNQAIDFNPIAQRSIEWTRKVIQSSESSYMSFLEGLVGSKEEDDVLFVHASPRNPIMEYLMPSDCFHLLEGVPDKIQENFDLVERLCFFGHTHKPGVITEEGSYLKPDQIDFHMEFDPEKKFMVNVGSVGQPRDGDPRSCYVITDGQSIEFRKVSYDIENAQEKIRNEEELDDRLAHRLSVGE